MNYNLLELQKVYKLCSPHKFASYSWEIALGASGKVTFYNMSALQRKTYDL